jgi:hypothetical protein
MEIINDALGFLAGIIEQFEIGGIGDVGRRAGGIDDKLTTCLLYTSPSPRDV